MFLMVRITLDINPVVFSTINNLWHIVFMMHLREKKKKKYPSVIDK